MTVADSATMNHASRRSTRIPDVRATSGSNVENVSSRRNASTKTAIAAPTTTMAIRSPRKTANTFPNSTVSRDPETAPLRLWMASPIANEAVVTTPMAASAPTVDRVETRPISSAARTPQTPAPMKNDTPSTADTAAPPNTACESPWPM